MGGKPMRAIELAVISSLILAPAAAAPRAITGAEIRSTLIGNTISGVEDGKDYEEFLHPDGWIFGQEKDGSYKGRWVIENEKLCLLYEAGHRPGKSEKDKWECVTVGLEGTKVI